MLLQQLAEILKSYVSSRTLAFRQEEVYAGKINNGPLNSILGAILYLLYKCDIPHEKVMNSSSLSPMKQLYKQLAYFR